MSVELTLVVSDDAVEWAHDKIKDCHGMAGVSQEDSDKIEIILYTVDYEVDMTLNNRDEELIGDWYLIFAQEWEYECGDGETPTPSKEVFTELWHEDWIKSEVI